ncbi:MAG: recombinase family protein [Actinobacteria bacterium]|nr:recombinase family protein [Actinomycetota bacterium]
MNCLIYLRVSTKEQASKNAEKEGYSLPAQREACLRHIRDKGWSYVDEYVDRGESARSSQRPQLQEMLSRIKKDGTIDAVVVHKIDRLARNMEDHVAIKAILKKHKVSLVSVVENIEDSASGQFMEGILALMAEFYSANLAMETKKGQLQKVKSGGWPQMAPLGYLNVREFQIGRLIRYITVDEERAPFVKLAFELYSTGEYSLTELQKELAKRGFKSRPNRKSPGTPVAKSYIAKMLRNEFYTGVVVWQGVRYQGTQEPLITKELYDRVQLVMDSHDQAGERKRKHPHYLRGTLYCGECGARLSSLIAKGEYTYFYCLGQKRKNGCGQLYVLDVDIEKQIEELYKRINLPSYYTDKLVTIFKQEILSRDDANAREKQFLAARLSKLADKRVKLMDAFYAEAISPELLKSEQDRIDGEVAACESRLALLKDKFDQFEEVLNLAVKMASSCHMAYMKANPKRKRMLNQAFFKKILIKEKQIEEVIYTDLFDLLFRRSLNSDSLVAGAGL